MNRHAPDFRTLIQSEFESRKRKNSGYSLRSYARDLGVAPSKLSELLRGLRGISQNTARKIAAKMRLNAGETDWFLRSVAAQHSRSQKERASAAAALSSLADSHGFNEINLDRFKIIADWHHFALLELTDVAGFDSSPDGIAARLGIPIEEAEAAIQRLLDFGLLDRHLDGRLFQTNAHLATPSGIPSREIRRHHSQILERASRSLEEVPVEERDLSSSTMAFAAEDLPEVREIIKTFRRQIGLLAQKKEAKNRVYCLSTQFFPLDSPLKGTS